VSRNLLIDGMVRQMMVTIGQIATTGGVRTPLAHVANEVFLSLAKELESQGVGRKIIADMFGLTLRAYHIKVRRIGESRTVGGRSLWTAIHGFIAERESVPRVEVQRRFARDEASSVAGILNDLVKSGLIFRSGEGKATVYRTATSDDLAKSSGTSIDSFVWMEVHRRGPITLAELGAALPALSLDAREQALERLTRAGSVQRAELDDGAQYTSPQLLIPLDDPEGWEAAVLDHFQTVATTIGVKAQRLPHRSAAADRTGGSTFHFDLSDEHPLRDEVLSLLRRFREEASDLRKRVEEQFEPSDHPYRVSLYVGQVVIDDREENA
jgi:hypothetical protein